MFGLPRQTIINLISEQLSIDGTEIANALAVSSPGDVVSAVVSALPVANLSTARMKSSFHFLSHLEIDQKAGAIDKIKTFSQGFPDVPEDFFYLSRIVVSSACRRQNMGTVVLQKFADLGKDFPGLCLHVNAAKKGAIEFYINNGYEIYGPGDLPFLAMSKS